MERKVHIVAFDIPWPPDYGGVIDVFYTIRALHGAGIGVILHCFEYSRKGEQTGADSRIEALKGYCEVIFRYRRKTGPASFFHCEPYIMRSRRSEELVQNLCHDDHPIIFEGLHTCHSLSDPRLRGRVLVYRESNIEHEYYRHLARAERSIFKKIYFLSESIKLRRYESVIDCASLVLTVSESDRKYLQSQFPEKKVLFVPSFHKDEEVHSVPGKGNYVLYQGNLSVPENTAAVEYILDSVYTHDMPRLIIAGKNPPDRIIAQAGRHSNVDLVINPDDQLMSDLIRNAHVNLMLTFQPTGLKLKLLNALYNGRFCLVNPNMLEGTGLEPLCIIAETPDEFRAAIQKLSDREFDGQQVELRNRMLSDKFSNRRNLDILIRSCGLKD